MASGIQPLGNLLFLAEGAAIDEVLDEPPHKRPRVEDGEGSERRESASPSKKSIAAALGVRANGLGPFRVLADELLLELLARMDARTLAILGQTSKAMYAFTRHEDLWRQLVLGEQDGEFLFLGRTWLAAYVVRARGGSLDGWRPAEIKTGLYSDVLFQPYLCATQPIRPAWLREDNVERRHGLTLEQFIDEYERPNKPVLITDVVTSWPAFQKWTRSHLRDLAGSTKFDVGPVEMSFDEYCRYADNTIEESPLYLFDKTFADKLAQLGADYTVPEYFSEDLFSVLEARRPDYRWLIMGPAKSGSAFHIDPNATSAWNACITGSKKWILYPPGCVPPGVHPSEDGSEVTSTLSLMEWFMTFYAKTKEDQTRPIEFVARAGDLVFVPTGWFHLVMNLEESIAVTQNYVSRRNLRKVLDLFKDKQHLISGLRECGGESTIYQEFCDGLEHKFPGELVRLEQQWADEDSAKRGGRKGPGVWETLKSNAMGEPFLFNFGFVGNGDREDEDDDQTMVE